MTSFNPFNRTFEECRVYTKQYAKSFYFSSFMLPKEKRYAAYAVYAFCRYADNVVDLSESPEETKKHLAKLTLDLERIYDGSFSKGKSCAFCETINKYKIPKRYFIELIEGVEMDNTIKRFNSNEDLDLYCYKVASVVGIIMCYVFGYSDDEVFEYAECLGKAMQITNILRDIKEDFEIGRVYIPQLMLQKFNYTEQDIKSNLVNQNFRKLLKYYIYEARYLYNKAYYGIPYLTNDGSRGTVLLMLKVYSGILDKIELQDYDIYTSRVYVSSTEKVLIYVKGLFEIQRTEMTDTIIF
ncbi:MAG: squalene/phytoene synthase family protein [Ignavibacteria bacterium]|jgi:phytoene synthase|nr:squalene/phytoene synthase family protein [Ignavibacteria bacterium]